ncbi:MAG: 30S ribosomal protein S6 [Candidatus Omnitrophica bacterium]|nr:30S ribosomal protein S6 [Candidatus Omnitrophota bacterium]
MNKYELVYIIDAHASQSVKDEITKQVNDAVVKSNVQMINSQIWLERHKMSFPINKIWEGTYYMLNIEAPAAAVNKLQGLLRLNEQILRFLTVKAEKSA